MKLNKRHILGFLLMSPLVFSCAEMKQAGRDIGHATRDATRTIGHGTRDITRKIGHGTRDAVKTVGHGTRDAVKSAGSAIKKSESETTSSTGPRSK